jgi:corrinoid protein of di/trimethylamine methyltransferase
VAVIDEIKEALCAGDASKVQDGVRQALLEGLVPAEIINDGLIAAMNITSVRFKNRQIYMPDVMVAVRAMRAGMDILQPLLAGDAGKEKGTMVIGTVKGDLHDIGKNLVKMMMEGSGFKVVDLGVDVPAEKFVQAVREIKPQLVCLSALLTTNMPQMKEVIAKLAPYRGEIKVMIGGAPITEQFAREIGADGYAQDAASAVDMASALLRLA